MFMYMWDTVCIHNTYSVLLPACICEIGVFDSNNNNSNNNNSNNNNEDFF